MLAKPILVHNLISRGEAIPTFVKNKISEQQNILNQLKSILPSSLAKQVIGCCCKQRNLILFTNSSAWASQLRFYRQQILESVKPPSKLRFDEARIRVLPPKLIETHKKSPRIPNHETINTLRESAEHAAHFEIQQALLRLAHTLTIQSNS